MLPKRYLSVKLNQDDIAEIMDWYIGTFDQRIVRPTMNEWKNGNERAGQKLSQAEINKNIEEVRSLLQNVPAIYKELIDNVFLNNNKTPYNDLSVKSPEHPAHHIVPSRRLFEREEETNPDRSRTGDYDIDRMLHMRITGQDAQDVFEKMTRGAFDLVKTDRAIDYCRGHGYDKEWQKIIESEKAVDDMIAESASDAEILENIIANRKADEAREIEDMILDGKRDAKAIRAVAESRQNEENILRDFRDSAALYKESQMTRKERLDIELNDKLAELAQKEAAFKEERRFVAKEMHPINFIARWSLRINQRNQQKNILKEDLAEFKASQAKDRDEIKTNLQNIDENIKTVDDSVKKGTPWHGIASEYSEVYKEKTAHERDVHAEWTTNREHLAEQKQHEEAERSEIERNAQARRDYENSFYEQPEPKKKAAFQDKKMFAENVQKKGSVNQKDSSVSKQPKELHDDFF